MEIQSTSSVAMVNDDIIRIVLILLTWTASVGIVLGGHNLAAATSDYWISLAEVEVKSVSVYSRQNPPVMRVLAGIPLNHLVLLSCGKWKFIRTLGKAGKGA